MSKVRMNFLMWRARRATALGEWLIRRAQDNIARALCSMEGRPY